MAIKEGGFSDRVHKEANNKAGWVCCLPECRAPLRRRQREGVAGEPAEVCHIVGRSENGPRGASSLTHAERASAENAIAACVKCARLLDIDVCHYTVDVLRNARDEAERLATEREPRNSGATPRSAACALPKAQSLDDVARALWAAPYSREATSEIRRRLTRQEGDRVDIGRVMALIAERFAQVVDSLPWHAGMLATLLTVDSDIWAPRGALLDRLSVICARLQKQEDPRLVQVLEPLVFVLWRAGRQGFAESFLRPFMLEEAWRCADYYRIKRYAGDEGRLYNVIDSHVNERNDVLERASEAGRFAELAKTLDPDDAVPVAMEILECVREVAPSYVFPIADLLPRPVRERVGL